MLALPTSTNVTGLSVPVVVLAVTPIQEHALEYRTEPEQAEAYVGILEGVSVA